jgi:hypothetical protein
MQLVLWSLRYMSVRKSGAVNVNFTKLEWLWAQFRRQLIYRAIIIGPAFAGCRLSWHSAGQLRSEVVDLRARGLGS